MLSKHQMTIRSDQKDIVIFMDDTTLYEIIDVTNHVSGNCIGNSQSSVNNIIRFMELNAKKCNEMIVACLKKTRLLSPSLHRSTSYG